MTSQRHWAHFARRDGGGRMFFPFELTPRFTDNVTENLMQNVYFYNLGEASAPWTGYWTLHEGTLMPIENYCGVWFSLQWDESKRKHFAIRVAPDSYGLVHLPASNINMTDLKFQTQQHGVPDLSQPLPPSLGIAHAIPAPVTSRLPASRPMTPASDVDSNFADDDSTPRTNQPVFTPQPKTAKQFAKPFQIPSRPSSPGGGGPPPSPGAQLSPEDVKMQQVIKDLRGDRLEGTPPKPYNGDRSDTQRFILAFDRYTFMNHTATIMQDPMKRTALFLRLLDGKALAWENKVSTWLKGVRDGRETVLFGHDVWQVVEREFRENFTDFADADKAYRELEHLRMKEGRLDEYISTFQDLATCAGMDLSAPNTMNTFAKGLQGSLAVDCIKQDNPENFPQWVQSAQQNHRSWLKIQSLKNSSPFQQMRAGTNPFTWRRNNNNRGGQPQQRIVERDPNAMEVDAIRKAVTEADKERYRTEGRCFNCGRRGHLSRVCPDKKPRIAATILEPTNPPPLTPVIPASQPEESMESRIRKMAEFSMTLNTKQQEMLATELQKLGADFH